MSDNLQLPLLIPCAVARQDAAPPREGVDKESWRRLAVRAAETALEGEEWLLGQYAWADAEFEFTGCGLYMHFSGIPEGLRLEGRPDCVIGRVVGSIPGMRGALFCDMFVRNGMLAFLEISSTFDTLPDSAGEVVLVKGRYEGGGPVKWFRAEDEIGKPATEGGRP